jgi:hypothetical protein
MKRMMVILSMLLPAFLFAQTDRMSVRVGGGYAHDFPGLNGYAIFAEYTRSLSEKWQGAIGMKWNQLEGFPRTKEVKEFTKAFALDFILYFLPVSNEVHQVRLGAGYSFSFYDIRRTYPVIVNDGGTNETLWPVQDQKGRASGILLVTEYEFYLPNSNLSFGARGSLYKSFDYVLFAGAYIGIRI